MVVHRACHHSSFHLAMRADAFTLCAMADCGIGNHHELLLAVSMPSRAECKPVSAFQLNQFPVT